MYPDILVTHLAARGTRTVCLVRDIAATPNRYFVWVLNNTTGKVGRQTVCATEAEAQQHMTRTIRQLRGAA